MLCALPWLNAGGWREIMGNFYALYVGGLPFADPLGVAQSLAGGHVPGTRLWLGAALTLAVALVWGRVFCGWICPYGLLSELIWRWRGPTKRREQTRTKVLPGKMGDAREGWTWCLGWRLALTLAGLVGTAVLGVPVLNALSGPGLLSLAPQMALEDMVMVAVVLAIPALLLAAEALTGQRWWCRSACPQALLLMLASALGEYASTRLLQRRGTALCWTADACVCKQGELPCVKACSLGLWPRGKKSVDAALCTRCGDCVSACARRGNALRLKVFTKDKES